jgi:diaminopimelate decarboxylase
LKAVGAHLGSQITTIEPFIEEANALIDNFLQAQAAGHQVGFINIGGGFSIDYEEGEALDIKELAAKLIPIFKEVDAQIIFEPGRFLVGDSGLLITRVLGVKPAGNLTYIFVDAGMNDLIRPSLYEAYHEAVPLAIRDGEEITANIVGPVSGTRDFLGLERPLVKPQRGEFLAFLNAGAYCSTMASNYNSRRRAAEVLIENDDFTVIRHRETWEDLYRNDVLE